MLGAVLLMAAAAPEQPTEASRLGADAAPYVVAPAVTVQARSEKTMPAEEPAASAAAPPRAVRIASLSVSAPVVGVRMDTSGGLTPPDDPQVLGWWSEGAPAGAVRGSTLVTGHTVHTGGGALDDLEDVPVGAGVRVDTEGGAVDYVVTAVRVYSKGRLAQRAADLFSQSVPHRLVLVTCEDWNGATYESNVVVVARPV